MTIPTGLILLNDKYMQIARLLLIGTPQVEIARELGMSPHSISNIVTKNTLFKRAMSELQEVATRQTFNLRAFMEAHARDAAQVIVDAMQDSSTPLYVRRQAAKDVLGLAGYRNENTPKNTAVVVNQSQPVSFEDRVKKVEAISDVSVCDEAPSEHVLESGSDAHA
jgi:hypothetical protein